SARPRRRSGLRRRHGWFDPPHRRAGSGPRSLQWLDLLAPRNAARANPHRQAAGQSARGDALTDLTANGQVYGRPNKMWTTFKWAFPSRLLLLPSPNDTPPSPTSMSPLSPPAPPSHLP